MTRNKRFRVVLALCLTGVLIVGSAWAYLSKVTQQETNVFTFVTGLTATLTEPSWPTDGSNLNLTPAATIPKDPQITNTSSIDEYVAIKLTFVDGSGTKLTAGQMTKLLTLIDIGHGAAPATAANKINGINTTNWTLVASAEANSPEQIWYYNAILPHTTGNVTVPIFDRITIKSTISNADYAWLQDATSAAIGGNDALGGFKILVQGAAVQTTPVFASALAAAGSTTGSDEETGGLYYLLKNAA